MITVGCQCGASVQVVAHTCIDISQQPELLAELVAGKLHHAQCRRCGKHVQVDKWFLVRDPRRKIMVHVFPDAYRAHYHQLRMQIEPLHHLCGFEAEEGVQIVFGLSGLLEYLQGEQIFSSPLLVQDTPPQTQAKVIH